MAAPRPDRASRPTSGPIDIRTGFDLRPSDEPGRRLRGYYHRGGPIGGVTLYERVADLPLTVTEATYGARERDTSSGFTRRTTTVELRGDGCVGRGEDVTYENDDHERIPTRNSPGSTRSTGSPRASTA